jgi:hypothetical protein
VAGFFEHVNELSVFINRKFLDYLSVLVAFREGIFSMI